MDAAHFPVLMLFGGAACAAVAVGAVWSAVDHRLRVRGRRRRVEAGRAAFRQQIQTVAALARARRDQSLAWEGLRDFRVAAIVDECRDVKSFYLAATDDRPLPRFMPGQYLTVHLPNPFQNASGGSLKPIVRCYSLSDRPREEFYRLTVKLCRPPSGNSQAPPGVGTSILHSQVAVGDVLRAAAPRGEFALPASDNEPVALIGAGIGVTPLLSMALSGAHARSARETYLLLGMRNSEEFPFKQTIAELTSDQPNLHTFVTYSRPTERDRQQEDYHHRGRINLEYVRSVLPSNNFRFYLCGPPGMLESLTVDLLDWGVPDDRIHFEAFGAASVPRLASNTAARGVIGARVSFARSDVVAEWTDEDRSLLGLAERVGVPMRAGCRVGNCGECTTRVVDGEVSVVKSPGAGTGAGECLTCVSVPTGELVLEA